jgi:hypothetical protein
MKFEFGLNFGKWKKKIDIRKRKKRDETCTWAEFNLAGLVPSPHTGPSLSHLYPHNPLNPAASLFTSACRQAGHGCQPSSPLMRSPMVGPLFCHTRFWKANRMHTMDVPRSETHVHSDYIIRHHHTLLKINSRKGTLLHQDVQDIHRVINITLSLILSKCEKANIADTTFICSWLGVCH